MQAGERQPSRSGEPGVRAGVADRAGVQSELPSPAGALGNWGVSPKSLGKQPCALRLSRPGPAVGIDRAPRACCPRAASATQHRLRATFKPGQDASPELPPQRSESLLPLTPLECLSHPAVPTPHDPRLRAAPPRVLSGSGQRHGPQLPSPGAAHSTWQQIPLALPRDAPRALPRCAGRPAPQPGPCSSAQAPYCPGQRPQSTHHWPAQGPAGAHLTHSKGRSRAAAPRPPRRSALPSLPRRPAWQQPWTLPQTFPRDTPAHSAPFSASPVPQDGTLPQMLCVPPVYFVTCFPRWTPSPVKAWPSPCGHHVPPAPRAVAGRVNDQLVLPKQMEEKTQTLLGNVISFPHNYVHF